MGQASKQRYDLPTSADFSVDKHPSIDHNPTVQTPIPILRLSPRHSGSNLLDSFELRAVTRQLNKAIQGSSGSSPTYLNYINSPFYRQRLDCIYRENTETPRRIMCLLMTGANLRRNVSRRGTRPASKGFATRLWKKVKQGLQWNKQ